MTRLEALAKQKVRSVYPDARPVAWDDGNGGVGGYAIWANNDTKCLGEERFEEAAWQNAAESLPAQPERKLGTCMASFVQHTKGTACIGWVPVASVEAKEKVCETTMTVRAPRTDCHCDTYPGNLGPCSTFEASQRHDYCAYCDHRGICHRAHWGYASSPVAEPKPTPSTWLKCVYCGRFSEGGEYHEQQCDSPIGYKPQPDSSSIPDEKEIAHRMNGDFAVRLMAFRKDLEAAGLHGHYSIFQKHFSDDIDSSSISTEQTFEEFWKSEEAKSWVYGHLMETYPIAFRYVAQTFWNAAKGQSNGR